MDRGLPALLASSRTAFSPDQQHWQKMGCRVSIPFHLRSCIFLHGWCALTCRAGPCRPTHVQSVPIQLVHVQSMHVFQTLPQHTHKQTHYVRACVQYEFGASEPGDNDGLGQGYPLHIDPIYLGEGKSLRGRVGDYIDPATFSPYSRVYVGPNKETEKMVGLGWAVQLSGREGCSGSPALCCVETC